MLSERCKDRLFNYKFRDAENCLDDEVESWEKEGVIALSRMFGNPGWFVSGDPEATMSIIIDLGLRALGVYDEEPED